jgi:hypothetical protein
MLVGSRDLVNLNDNLKYSLDPRLNPDKYVERRGIIVNGTVDFGKLTAKKSNIKTENLGYLFCKKLSTPYNQCNASHVCYPLVENVLLLVNLLR